MKTVRRKTKTLTDAQIYKQEKSPKNNHKLPLRVLFVIIVVSTVFIFASWGNLSKNEKEEMYIRLSQKELKGKLSPDSINLFCALAKELKKEIPDCCREKIGYTKSSNKNGKHQNLKKKLSEAEKMVIAKNERDSLRRLPNKSPTIKKQLIKAEKAYKRHKKNADESGENHNQKAQGNKTQK